MQLLNWIASFLAVVTTMIQIMKSWLEFSYIYWIHMRRRSHSRGDGRSIFILTVSDAAVRYRSAICIWKQTWLTDLHWWGLRGRQTETESADVMIYTWCSCHHHRCRLCHHSADWCHPPIVFPNPSARVQTSLIRYYFTLRFLNLKTAVEVTTSCFL